MYENVADLIKLEVPSQKVNIEHQSGKSSVQDQDMGAKSLIMNTNQLKDIVKQEIARQLKALKYESFRSDDNTSNSYLNLGHEEPRLTGLFYNEDLETLVKQQVKLQTDAAIKDLVKNGFLKTTDNISARGYNNDTRKYIDPFAEETSALLKTQTEPYEETKLEKISVQKPKINNKVEKKPKYPNRFELCILYGMYLLFVVCAFTFAIYFVWLPMIRGEKLINSNVKEEQKNPPFHLYNNHFIQ